MGNKRSKANQGVSNHLLGILTMVILAGLFWGGFYYKAHKLFLTGGLCLLFTVYNLVKLKTQEIRKFDYLDVIGFLWFALTLTSLLTPLYFRDAVGEVGLNFIYLMIFLSFRRINKEKLGKFLDLLFIGIAIMAFIGILEYCGFIHIVVNRYGLRLQSTLQYANTTAIVCWIGYLLGIASYREEEKLNLREYIRIGLTGFILFAFLLTFSRGAMLVAIPMLIFYLLIIKGKEWYILFPRVIVTAVPILVAVPFFTKLINNKEPLFALLILVLAIGVILGAFYLMAGQERQITRKSLVSMIIVSLLAVVAINIAYGNPVIKRVANINHSTATMDERLAMYKDAIKIVKDYPFTGVGEGGWKVLYQSYQTQSYIANEIHNNILKMGVNYGIPTLLVYMLFWGTILFVLIKDLLTNSKENSNSEDMKLNKLVLIIILSILLHSLMDFDLSLPIISMLIWALAGSALGLRKQHLVTLQGTKQKNNRSNNHTQALGAPAYQKIILIGLPVILTIISTFGVIGFIYGEEGVKLVNKGDYAEGISRLEKAVVFDPINSKYFLALAKANESTNQQIPQNTKNYYQKALKVDKYSRDINMNYGVFLINNNDPANGVITLKKVVKNYPSSTSEYPLLVNGFFTAANQYIQQNNRNLAMDCFNNIITLTTKRDLKEDILTPEIRFVLGQIYYFKHNYKEALKQFSLSRKISNSLKDKVLMWETLSLDKLGNEQQVKLNLIQLKAINTDLISKYQFIKESTLF